MFGFIVVVDRFSQVLSFLIGAMFGRSSVRGFERSKPSGIEFDSMDHRCGNTRISTYCVFCVFFDLSVCRATLGDKVSKSSNVRRRHNDEQRTTTYEDGSDDDSNNVLRVADLARSPAQSSIPVSD